MQSISARDVGSGGTSEAAVVGVETVENARSNLCVSN
jgi:hypothetical protein